MTETWKVYNESNFVGTIAYTENEVDSIGWIKHKILKKIQFVR